MAKASAAVKLGAVGQDSRCGAVSNRPVSYSDGWTGFSMKWRLMQANLDGFRSKFEQYLQRLFTNSTLTSWMLFKTSHCNAVL